MWDQNLFSQSWVMWFFFPNLLHLLLLPMTPELPSTQFLQKDVESASNAKGKGFFSRCESPFWWAQIISERAELDTAKDAQSSLLSLKSTSLKLGFEKGERLELCWISIQVNWFYWNIRLKDADYCLENLLDCTTIYDISCHYGEWWEFYFMFWSQFFKF